MSRRAIWRVRWDDPKMPLGWFRREEVPTGLPLPVAAILFVVLCVLAVRWNPWFWLAMAAIPFYTRRIRPLADLTDLRTVPPPGPAFNCRVEVSKNDFLLGEDDGIVTFVDGWLHFAGTRTDFSLRPADVREMDTVPYGRRMRLMSQTVTFFIRDEELHGNFKRASAIWQNVGPERGGESVLPPETMHETGMARARMGLVRALIGFTVLASAAFFFEYGSVVFVIFISNSQPLRRYFHAMSYARKEKRQLANQPRPVIGP